MSAKSKPTPESRQAPGVRTASHAVAAAFKPRRSIDGAKVGRAIDALGTKSALAQYLGVARTQPGQWETGAEVPRPETARLMKDLDYVWDRLTTDTDTESATIWLNSPNGFLNSATPLAWLRQHGPAQVIGALDAAEAGSYV